MLVRYYFHEFAFSPITRELRRKGDLVELPPTVLAMLAHLIDNRHRVCTREELAKAAWPDRFVADHTLTARLSDLRRALASGKRPNPVRTVYGEGVRFVGEVTTDNPTVTFAERAEEAAGLKEQTKGRPSIAVLPFRQTSGSPEQIAVSDALPDDIISELTNLRWLFVIARGSTFRFPSYEHSLADIGRELQVRYCLSGEVRDEGDKLRISVELAETIGETILWRDSFTTKVAGAHELRQEIVSRIASELDRRITDHEIAQARLKNPNSLDAWGAYHNGLAKVLGHNTQNLDGALADFSCCVEFDPRFARGYAGLVHTRWLRTLQLELDQKAAELTGMIEAAKQAEQIDPGDPSVLVSMGRASMFTGQIDTAKGQFRHALKIAPSSTAALTNLAGLHMLLGESEASINANSEAIALSPLDPNMHTWLATQMGALLQLNRAEEAVRHADRAIASPRAIMPTYAMALLTYYLADQQERGRQLAQQLKQMQPDVSVVEISRKMPMLQRFKDAFAEAFAEFGLNP
ncbi:MAG: winged helix-turn-helix domain-containing protein [Pseudomonadota bacterium]